SRQRDSAAAKQAAARANALRGEEPLTAMLLSVAAWRIAPVTEAKAAMQAALAQRERSVLRPRLVTGDAAHELSADGRTLVVVDGGQAVFWDVATRRRTRVIGGVSGLVRDVALSADGRRLAVAAERRIALYDTERNVRIAEFGEGARWVAFGPRRLLLAAVTPRGPGQVWDLTSQTLLPLDVPEAGDLAFSADDGLMAATAPGGRYELWNWQGRLARPAGDVLAFSPDGRTLAVGTGGGVRFRDLATGRWRATALKGVRARLLRYSRDGAFLAAFDGARIGLWAEDGTRLMWHPVAGVVAGLRFGPDAGTLAYSLLDGMAVVLDVADLTRPRRLAGDVEAGLIDPATRTAILRRSRVELWSIAGRRRLARLPASLSAATAMALGPSGLLAVGTAPPAAVTLWDARTSARRGTFAVGDATQVGGLAFSPDGGTLAVAPFRDTVTPPAKNRRNVQLWEVRRGALTRTLPVSGGSGLTFRPDGRELAIDGEDHALVDVATGKVAGKPFGPTPDGVRAIAFSPDGKIITTGALASWVGLWEAAGHRPLGRLSLQAREFEEVDLLAFAPDSRTLAVGGMSGVQ
ncbi:WD40 repeat domain-containing protein, partial [Nonomuraea lactucae]|uniref:WD40 repeat domain-containing protein n=1 Tax=Nonomuraea lactucae TaxID=2249762 RepID=UPI001965E5FB